MINISELLAIEEGLKNEVKDFLFDSDYDDNSSVVKNQIIKKHISVYNNMPEESIAKYKSFNLSKEEGFILWVFTGYGSKSINQTLSDRVPKLDKLQQLIVGYFDNILSKIKRADINVVSRIDKHSKELKENAMNYFCSNKGRVIKIPWFLSTTIKPWIDDSPLIWEIKLLPQSQTKAHSIYDIVENHGEEWEVRFERNVKFLVSEIKDEGSKIMVSLEEVDPNIEEHTTLSNCDYWDKEQ